MKNYKQELVDEVKQFIFLADTNDVKMLISRYQKKNLPEFVRLACLALTFGYKKQFLKIFTTVQRDTENFLAELDKVDFRILENWVISFISRVKDGKVQELCRMLWEERKKQIDLNNFSLRQLL